MFRIEKAMVCKSVSASGFAITQVLCGERRVYQPYLIGLWTGAPGK
jgi:hypothetical protein